LELSNVFLYLFGKNFAQWLSHSFDQTFSNDIPGPTTCCLLQIKLNPSKKKRDDFGSLLAIFEASGIFAAAGAVPNN
jgi:hypothetical protein